MEDKKTESTYVVTPKKGIAMIPIMNVPIVSTVNTTPTPPVTEVSIKTYAQSIERMASTYDPMPFMNHGKDYAAIVMSNIFKYSTSEIHIFAGNFGGGVSSQEIYLNELRSFLARGGKVRIILEDYKRENNPVLFDILSDYKFFNKDSVSVFLSDVELYEKETENKIHFAVGDTSIYRREEDTEKYVATGSFSDKTEAEKFLKIFKDISENHSAPIDIN